MKQHHYEQKHKPKIETNQPPVFANSNRNLHCPLIMAGFLFQFMQYLTWLGWVNTSEGFSYTSEWDQIHMTEQ